MTAPQDWAARQPLAGGGGRFVLIFDGYLVNREELAVSLDLGIEADGWADCAYAMAALERWGDDAPARLRGDFALAVWDCQARRLLLARDAIGQRPLYYHEGDGWVAFATNARALLALPEVPAGIDEQRFADYLLDLPGDPSRSFHAAIRRLPAASIAVFTGSRSMVACYWQPDYERRIRFKRDDDYVEAARELLDQSVRACLRIAGPPCAALTGGLDSSAVAITAAGMLAPGRLTTMTSVPAEGVPQPHWSAAYADERPYVEAIARMHPSLDPHFVPGSDLHRWDERWAEMFLLTGMPWRNVMNMGWFGPLRDRARALGATVLLSGMYGNLTLSWDGAEGLAAMARGGRWPRVVREISALAARTGTGLPRQLWRSAIRPNLPEGMLAGLDRLRGRPGASPWASTAINPDFASACDAPRRIAQHRRALKGGSATIRRAAFTGTQNAADALGLVRSLFGLEMRNPLADRRLLEFCFAVPDDQYLRGGVTRALARRVLADRLPPDVVNNCKRGVQAGEFFHRMTLMRGVIASGVEELERSPLARRMLDVPRMKAMVAAWPEDASAAGLDYLSVLHRGLHCGQFLRWIEGGNL